MVIAFVLFMGDDPRNRPDPMSPRGPLASAPTAADGEHEADDAESASSSAMAEASAATASASAGTTGEVAAGTGRASPRRGDAGMLVTNAREALQNPMLYETEHERARREEAQRNRNWRSLDLVEGLIGAVDEGIAAARAEGDTERVEKLEASKARLETRRDALRADLRGAARPEQPR